MNQPAASQKPFSQIVRRKLLYLLIFPILFLMLLFPENAASGAMNGLMLWFQTLLPVLLPFLILSGLIISLQMTRPINRFFAPILTRLFPISQPACYPLVLGLLCGMPLGAKTTADLYRAGKLTDRDALFLLGFSNHASLMFLISYVSTKELAQPAHTLFFLLIIYFSAWAVTRCLLPVLVPAKIPDSPKPAKALSLRIASVQATPQMPARTPMQSASHTSVQTIQHASVQTVQHVSIQAAPTAPTAVTPVPTFFAALDQSIMDGFATITKVGGYIILFSMLASFVQMLPLPEFISVFFSGLLEITSGIHAICASSLSSMQKTALTIAATTFGGLSGLMQTRSVTLGTGLSIKSYLILKILQAACAYFLALTACRFLW